MNKDVFFSFIIPAFNVADYLHYCIDSVLDSNYNFYEILIIDDGSTDRTGEIADYYANNYSNIKVFHKTNGGLSDARNYGIKNAKGDYIIFLDSDDAITVNVLEDLNNIIQNTPYNPDIIITELTNTYDMLTKENITFDIPSSNKKEEVLKFVFGIKANTFPAPQYICRRDFILENNLYFEKGFLHEDNGWTPLAFVKATYYNYYNKVWYFRRIGRNGSITSSINSKRAFDAIELTVSNIKSPLFNMISNQTKKIMFNTMVSSSLSGLLMFNRYSKDEQVRLIALIQKNFFIYEHITTIKYKLFVVAMKVLGVKNALRILSTLKGY